MSAKYQRILLKLSGEALMGDQNFGIDPQVLTYVSGEVKGLIEQGIQVGLVIGGGNIFRGVGLAASGMDRVAGDHMGMLATVINGLALQSAFESKGASARLFTAIRMEPVAEFYYKPRVIKALENNEIVIFSGGTGNPYFTTDSAAALRALEISADALLKGTQVDGVYDKDPHKHDDARRFEQLTYDEVIDQRLEVMDLTAVTLCAEQGLPMFVFDISDPDNLVNVIAGEQPGTWIRKETQS